MGCLTALAACNALLGIDEPTTLVEDPEDSSSSSDARSEAGSADGDPSDVGSDATAETDAASTEDAAPFLTLGTGLNGLARLAVNATHIYFTTGDQIRRCPRAGCGGGTGELVIGGQAVVEGLLVSGNTLYWTADYRKVRRCDVAAGTAGSSCIIDQIYDEDGTHPADLWLYGQRIYWLSNSPAIAGSKEIRTCPLSGCTAPTYPKTIYVSTVGDGIHDGSLTGLALDGAHAYVATFFGRIVRLTMAGPEGIASASSVVIQPDGSRTLALTLDGTFLRWPLFDDGTVRTCTVPNCSDTSNALTGRASPSHLVPYGAFLYGVDRGPQDAGTVVPSSGTIWRSLK